MPEPAKSQRELQSLFVVYLGQLIRYATERGYSLTLGEGFVQTPRKTRGGYFTHDGVHMPKSLHYERLAQDLNLFVDNEYVTSGEHFAWVDLGGFWEGLAPGVTRWGGRFKNHDANHFSVEWQGRA